MLCSSVMTFWYLTALVKSSFLLVQGKIFFYGWRNMLCSSETIWPLPVIMRNTEMKCWANRDVEGLMYGDCIYNTFSHLVINLVYNILNLFSLTFPVLSWVSREAFVCLNFIRVWKVHVRKSKKLLRVTAEYSAACCLRTNLLKSVGTQHL